MFKIFVEILEKLPVSDRWLLGVSLLILIKYEIALVLSLGIILGFSYRFVKELAKEMERNG